MKHTGLDCNLSRLSPFNSRVKLQLSRMGDISRWTWRHHFWHGLGVTGRWVCLMTACGDTPAVTAAAAAAAEAACVALIPRTASSARAECFKASRAAFDGITSHTTKWSGCMLLCPGLLWLSASEQQQRCKASCATASSSWYASDITKSQEVREVFRHCFATCLCWCAAAIRCWSRCSITDTAVGAPSVATAPRNYVCVARSRDDGRMYSSRSGAC